MKKKKKSGGDRKRTGKAGKGRRRMLSRDQQRELLALGLLVLALFVFLALTPTTFLGARSDAWFPSGNFMGAVGGGLSALLIYYLGVASLLIPVLLALFGLRSGDWLSLQWTLRLVVLSLGLLLFFPPGLHVLEPGSGAAGALGAWLGSPLLGGLGAFGSLFLLSALILLLIIGTLGWNPLRPLGRGAVQGAGMVGMAGKGALRAGLGFSGWLQERAEKRKAQRAEAEAMKAPADAGSFSFSDVDEHGVDSDVPVEEIPDGSGDDPFREQIPEEDEGGEVDGVKEGELGSEEEEEAADSSALRLESDAVDDLPDPNPQRSEVPHELPSLDHLDNPDLTDWADMEREVDRLGQVLIQKLKTFSVESSICGRTTGPVVTQFEVVPAPGVKVNKIANLDADLALAMKARSIRIVAPIPGKGAVGVEIPNPKAKMVLLREILEAREFARQVLARC